MPSSDAKICSFKINPRKFAYICLYSDFPYRLKICEWWVGKSRHLECQSLYTSFATRKS